MPRRVVLCLLVVTLGAFGLGPARSVARASVAGDGVVVLRGEILRDTLLKRKKIYLLQDTVTVRAGATLTIRPGVTVFADVGARLVVERGATLRAIGTAERPIVFTSAQPEAERRRGDWGGVVVNGRAPVNVPGGETEGDAGSGRYGGYEPDDDSGELRFVRVEYAGYPNGPDSRSDGLSLRGVGDRTVVDSVECLNGDGAGVGVLGGTADLVRVASVGNARAGFEVDRGWTGDAQFLLAQQRGDVRSSSYVGLRVSASTPHVANVTIVGGATGVRFGTGARGVYDGLVVTGCSGAGVDVRDDATIADLRRGDLEISGAIVARNDGGNVSEALRAAAEIDERDPRLANGFDEAAPDFRPLAGSPALERAAVTPPGAFFTPAAYAGAFGAGDDGWLGVWTNFETPPAPRYLANASSSPAALATSFLDALAASDVVAIKRLRITKKEFCWYVWPELPASSLPNVTCDFAWSQATLNSLSGLTDVLRAEGGRRLTLVSVRFAGGEEVYDGYVVHKDTRVTVRDASGAERETKLFGSMLELDGRFKLFSFVVD